MFSACCFNSVDDETTIYGKIAELVARGKIIEWYDGMLAQNKAEHKLKAWFLELLENNKGNVNLWCRISELDLYRINFGYGNYDFTRDDIKNVSAYHNRRGNVTPGAVIAVNTAIAKNNIEDIKKADRRIPTIRPGMAARIANKRANGGYNNNNNNSNNNNNNNNNTGGGSGGRSRRTLKFQSSFSNASGIPPVPELPAFKSPSLKKFVCLLCYFVLPLFVVHCFIAKRTWCKL